MAEGGIACNVANGLSGEPSGNTQSLAGRNTDGKTVMMRGNVHMILRSVKD